MPLPPRPRETSVVLALGPTNTGKTHRAVTRMLEFGTGMIGLPLRLLAREVYDRVSRSVGEASVALVTGEEKRIPRAPRYWVCTVEAMPLDRAVEFLAIDEIQLAAHRERGHVFTDRILHARGTHETWFLGSDTMAPALASLLPGASIERQARYSALRHAGRSGLAGLPPRSAVIAFSAAEVYELAARMREKKGGVAVVLGALSPRTRNAQVALYEAREVNYLVATDAIGMGLNLDVDHVAFAALEKFDGKETRPLDAAELGQIAGRAGRHRRDGTFGTLTPLPTLPERLVARLEEHRYPAVKRLVWRNSALSYGSLDELLGTLAAPVPDPRFSRVEQADDFDLLRILAARSRIRERAVTPEAVALLWDVCQIPDYRKLLLLDHAALLEELFVAIVDRGELEPGYVASRIVQLDRLDGDLDELIARLAAIRVWTYVAHRRAWIGPGLEEQAREVEDRLGDALHLRLVERFVERTRRTSGGSRPVETPRSGNFFAAIGGMLEDLRQAEARDRAGRIERIVAAPHESFVLDPEGRILFEGEVLGRLARGRELLTPVVRIEESTIPEAGSRTRVERRLAAFAKDLVELLLRPIESRRAEGLVRGILWQLERGLGTIPVRQARSELVLLGDPEMAALAERGVVVGRQVVYAKGLLTERASSLRAILARLHYGDAAPSLPSRSTMSFPREPRAPAEPTLAMGFVPLGPRAIRADALEQALASLPMGDEPFALPASFGGRIGVKAGELPRVMRALGYREAEGRRYRGPDARLVAARDR